MSKSRYYPRLKKGIINEKNYTLTSKEFSKLKKKKWSNFLKNKLKVNPLVRNDVFLIHNKILDLRKYYKNGVVRKQIFFAFFNSLKKNFLKKIFRYSDKASILYFVDKVELRLDLVLFRANFVNSLYNARSIINQKQVTVNSNLVCSSSFILKRGDIVELSLRKKYPIFSEFTLNFPITFLEVNYEIFSFIVLEKPSKKELSGFASFYNFFLGLFEIKNTKKL